MFDVQCAAGAGVFELQILEFSNYRLQLASGACCGGSSAPSLALTPALAPAPAPDVGAAGAGAAAAGAGGTCAHPCRTRFALCLKEYQSAAAPGACSFGRAASPVLGTDSFTLADPLYTLSLPFSFRWTVRFFFIFKYIFFEVMESYFIKWSHHITFITMEPVKRKTLQQ